MEGGRRVVGGELACSLHLRITGIRSRNWAGDVWEELLILFTFLQPLKDVCAAMVTTGRGKTLLWGLVKGETHARLCHLISVENPARDKAGAREEVAPECSQYYVRVHEGFKVHGSTQRVRSMFALLLIT